MLFRPVDPTPEFVGNFFAKSLLKIPSYKIDVANVKHKLDQNESPFDWPETIKQKVCTKLAALPWNRYPSAYADQVTELIAAYAQVSPENILTSPGTNHMIAVYLAALTRNVRGRVIIARPSFPLYESQCAVEGIEYDVWPLNEKLEYDLTLLPEVPAGSLIVFASPNNPVGNVLSVADLKSMLSTYPDSLILADEAYFEFTDETYTGLLEQHANLLIVRTCSKTLGAAGLRLGYSLASAALTQELKKARLPFLLNHFTLAAASEGLKPEFIREHVSPAVSMLKNERQRVYEQLRVLSQAKNFFVKESHANFFLVRWPDQERCLTVYRKLQEHNILVRNISGAPMLRGCLRVSLGTPQENDKFLAAAAAVF